MALYRDPDGGVVPRTSAYFFESRSIYFNMGMPCRVRNARPSIDFTRWVTMDGTADRRTIGDHGRLWTSHDDANVERFHMMLLMSTAPQQSSRAPRTIEDQHSCSTLLNDEIS